jgi:hypothetical protein
MGESFVLHIFLLRNNFPQVMLHVSLGVLAVLDHGFLSIFESTLYISRTVLCFPTCNRSEIIKNIYLSHKYPNYRVIHTYKQLYTLYSTRFKQSSNNHLDTSHTSTN